ncbi:hypothetical protein [Hydrogenophaga sp.]|uniref:hypothetical protein n=1 Tax=Hydrogenophaga sp. TaxID=1904254 RepID=UPI003D12D7B4
MLDFILSNLGALRLALLLIIILWASMRFGISFDFAGKGCNASEVRAELKEQIHGLGDLSVSGAIKSPFRLLAIVFFSIWLAVDRMPWLYCLFFALTLLPLFNQP